MLGRREVAPRIFADVSINWSHIKEDRFEAIWTLESVIIRAAGYLTRLDQCAHRPLHPPHVAAVLWPILEFVSYEIFVDFPRCDSA